MIQPILHVDNRFDALNLRGTGVNGYLKLKCLQLHDRVVGLAAPGDVVAISDNCPQTFIDYMLGTLQVANVLSVRYSVDYD